MGQRPGENERLQPESYPAGCGFCGAGRNGRWFLCALCGQGYCSPAHQAAALPEHRRSCGKAAASTPAPQQPGASGGLAGGTLAEPAELQARILGFAGPALRAYHGASQAARQATAEHVARQKAPWWLLDSRGDAALAQVLQYLAAPALLYSACACSAWRRKASSREAWASLRLSFGWGPDLEMQRLLRFLRRLAERLQVDQLPEAKEANATGGYPKPASPKPGSQLHLRRHRSVWLLQRAPSDGSAAAALDARREALQQRLEKEELRGKVVLELDAGAGLLGLSLAPYVKSMTLTSPDELSCRLIRLNASLQSTGRTKRNTVQGVDGPVPVYVYPLPISVAGAKTLARQWHWDSGSAMRALQPALLAPSFDLALCGSCETSEALEALLQTCNELMSPGAMLLVGSSHAVLPQQARFAVVREEVLHSPLEGIFRLMHLRKAR
ncbi:unnamed protein product [Effrenium voratum]|nr:unnamed protein product [Effrenium voratum]